VYYEIEGIYRTTVPGLLDATRGYPIDIGLMDSCLVVSPMDLSQRERHLEEILKSETLEDFVECDALIFGYGDTECLTNTKVGGVPYWPAWKPWPEADNGQQLEFLVQINFNGSKDLMPVLPGNILSIFVKENGYELPGAYWFWQDIDPERKNLAVDELPTIDRPMVATPAFVVACRTREFPKLMLAPGTKFSEHWEHLGIMRGSKIGGLPCFFSDTQPMSSGRFLAAIHSLRHPTGQPWPFVNHEKPLTPEQLGGIGVSGGCGCHDTVMFGDQGTIYIYLEDDGEISVRMLYWGLDEFLTMRSTEVLE
jgi:hypothetical protein